MNPTGTLHIHYGDNNTIIVSCNEIVVVEVSEKLNYTLDPHKNKEHAEYIETLYEYELIEKRDHERDERTIFKLYKGGTVYTLKNTENNPKVISLGDIQQIDNAVKILVINFKGKQSQYMHVENLQLLEVF